MHEPIPAPASPGASTLNDVIRHRRAVERSRIIGRSKALTLSARLAAIADRDGVIGRRTA